MKHFLKLVTLTLCFVFAFALLSFSAFADDEITVMLENTPLQFDVPPQIIDGRTMVPLRVIFEAMGATVAWDGDTQTIAANDDRVLMIAKIGQKEVTVNGTPIYIDVPPQIVNGRTLVPVRVVAESFGADVTWDGESKTAYIKKNSPQVDSLETQEKSRTMYSADGRKINVDLKDVSDYKKVYWYDEPVIIMYSVSGEKSVVLFSNVEKQKSVGWYEYPVTKMFAPDGRSQVFATENVEAQKSVGWYTYPVITLYAEDGTKIVVPTSESKKYLNSGWGKEPFVTLYTLDGKSKAFPSSKVADQKKVGWYEKDELQLVKNQEKIQSLVYSNSKKGSVTGLITWQYNKYVGTKPDVGAHVVLVQANKIPLMSDALTFLTFEASDSDPTMMSTTVDGNGNYYFDNIPAGEYYLIIESKATTASPSESYNCEYDANQYLTDVISTKAIDNLKRSGSIWKIAIVKITVKDGETTRYSKDWGNTYI